MALLRSLLILFVVLTMRAEGAARAAGAGGSAGAGQCPSDWRLFGNHCYKYFSETVTWMTAERNCKALGGHLTSVSSEAENHFLLSLVPTSSRCWIGANDAVEDGEWLWSDCSSSRYRNWCAGEPNNNGGPEDCVELNFSGNRCWNDVSCSFLMGYICAKYH